MKDRRDNGETPIAPAVLDELLEAVTPIAPPPALRARVLERARRAVSLEPIRSDQAWKPLAPGIEVKILMIDERAQTKSFLLRAQAGARLPSHAHRGCEECLVLQGDFVMGDVTLRAGDYLLAGPSDIHPDAYTRNGVVVYLRTPLDDFASVR